MLSSMYRYCFSTRLPELVKNFSTRIKKVVFYPYFAEVVFKSVETSGQFLPLLSPPPSSGEIINILHPGSMLRGSIH